MYELDYAPHEALGRAARTLARGGALYLGGGVGVERVDDKDDAKRFAVSSSAGKGTTYIGPLTAVTRAYELAGQSTAADSPGGATQIKSPAIAARVRELDAQAADTRRQLDRYRREEQSSKGTTLYFNSTSDDSWRARRIPELEAQLRSFAAERKRLLAGDLSETAVAEANWQRVGPEANRKLKGLKAHYAKMAHPFTACVRDNTKRFGAERAKRVCAVLKDLIRKSTKWRKGGKAKVSEGLALALDQAAARLTAVDSALGEGAVFRLAEGEYNAEHSDLVELAELVWDDIALLAFAGHPVAEVILEVAPEDQPRHRDGQWTNVLDRVRKSDEEHPLKPVVAPPEEPASEALMDSLMNRGGAARESVMDSLLGSR